VIEALVAGLLVVLLAPVLIVMTLDALDAAFGMWRDLFRRASGSSKEGE
jgi:hypothetical protein